MTIWEMARADRTDREIAAIMGLSYWTVRKWRRKAERQGRVSLCSRMGRPATGALGHFPLEVREAIREMRQAHPGWGPLTIRLELEEDLRFTGKRLPSRSRLAAFLRQEGLSRRYEHHSQLPQVPPATAQRPHDEWQMDAQGAKQVPQLGQVSLINIVDVLSRLKVDSWPHLRSSKPNARDYQLVLRRAFVEYGLPQRITLDHDSAFYDNTSVSPYPTGLHLWLIALGIEVCFTHKGRPTDHACIERNHQTIARQAIEGQNHSDAPSLRRYLHDRLHFLNARYPCRTLDAQPPLVAYPEACHSGRDYRPEWEESLLDLQHVYRYLAQGRWFRHANCHGEFWLGMQRYNAGRRFSACELEIIFDPQTKNLVCQPAATEKVIRFPVKGLTKADLMGELTDLITLPAYQLALPFSPEAWRHLKLCHCVTGTTS